MSEDSEPEDGVSGLAKEKVERILAKEKAEKLVRHINNVQEACYLLGKKLIERGEIDFGIRLIALGQNHDHSKWAGIEWEYLIQGEFNGEAKLAAIHHAKTNRHHPEHWGNVNDMPRLYVAEMVADWYSRSTEFGENIREYVKEKAIPRYKITPQGKVYKWIKEFLDLLLERPFTETPQDKD